jgi:chorismate mutase
MALRGLRGATTVAVNSKDDILVATKELLSKILAENKFQTEEVASILFTVTDGLNAGFPAEAAREIGWNDTPLMCMREIGVPGSLSNCIRVLILLNTDKKQQEMKHVYLREAVTLRR